MEHVFDNGYTIPAFYFERTRGPLIKRAIKFAEEGKGDDKKK